MYKSQDILSKFKQVQDYWHPHIIEELNGQHVKIAKVKGEFDWHSHPHEDELFIVWKGTLHIALRDGEVSIPTGSFYTIPKGVEHKPYTDPDTEVWIMMMEPIGTLNTGDQQTEKTVATPPRL